MRHVSALRQALLVTMLASPVAAQPHEVTVGLKIESGANQGLSHTDTLGTRYNYRYLTSTITNDGALSIHLRIALSSELDFPAACGDRKFKVFLLPDKLTPDTASLVNNITEGLDDFLDRCLEDPYVLDRTLEPGEQCVVTIGTLYPRPTNCGVVPIALFDPGDMDKFQSCDSLMCRGTSSNSRATLGVKLDYGGMGSPTECVLVPCGQISFSEP